MNGRLVILAAALLMSTGGGDAPAATPASPGGPALRNWYAGLQWSAGERDRWDVFNRDDLPPAAVQRLGRGGGLVAGRRFGDRFLLGLQLTLTAHDLAGVPERLFDAEFLVAGTVLFAERAVLQPFLRGGFGGGAAVLEHPGAGDGRTAALGTAAIAGGGLQLRLDSRFSLEAEAVANFTNFLEVQTHPDGDAPEEDWRVKVSQVGWRIGLGLLVWF